MLVSIDDMKSHLGIVDQLVAVAVSSDANGSEYNKTLTGDGSKTLGELVGSGYTFTSGSAVILGYQKTVDISGGARS